MSPETPLTPPPLAPRRRRSKAWVYYAILALLGVIAAPSSHGATLLLTLACAAYSVYLYLGGRFVFWIW